MLQTLTSETKTEMAQSKSQFMPMPERELHPHAFDVAAAYSLSGAGSGASFRSPEGHQRHILNGIQSSYGNQAVLRMLHSPQQVARMPALQPSQSVMLQRKCACGGTPGPEGECEACKAKQEATLQRHATNQSTAPAVNTAPPIVHDVLRSSGQPLDAGTRSLMEPRFGHDFGQVRVHTDAKAAESAQAVDALAYTVGRNVVFGQGQYKPGTNEGKKLMAHELTHVLQQSAASPQFQGALEINTPGDAYEKEADAIAEATVKDNTSRRTETNLNKQTTLSPTGMTNAGIVQRWEWEDIGRLLPGAKCLEPLYAPLADKTFNEFLPWYYNYAGPHPVPNKIWDAFGHCWIGCAGTEKCGSFKTAFVGKVREFTREYTPYGGPHDSYDQDTNNQAKGRGLGRQGLDCFNACRDLATSGVLDFSAPPGTLWTPDKGEYPDPAKNAPLPDVAPSPEPQDAGVPGGVPSEPDTGI